MNAPWTYRFSISRFSPRPLLAAMLPRELKVAKALWRLLQFHPWAVPVIVTLGVLSSLAEGIGITLFIPFLKTLDGEEPALTGHGWVDWLNRLFTGFSPDNRFWIISGAIFGSILLKACMSYGNALVFRWIEADIGHKIRSGILQQLMRVNYRFIEQNDTGRLLNALSTESWRTSEALNNFVNVLITGCTTLVYIGLLILISWQLTLVVTLGLIVISLAVGFFTRRVKALGKAVTRTNAILGNRMVEGIEGMKIIRAFGQEKHERERFDRSSWKVSRVLMRVQVLADSVAPVYETLAAALLVGILLTAASNPQNLPAILVFIFVLYRLQPRVMALEAARVKFTALAAAVDEVTTLLDPRRHPHSVSGTVPFGTLTRAITFEQVTFHYQPGGRAALRNVSFQIPAGKATALVGPSGAGKSTAIHLLLRLYEPDNGEIYVGEQRLRDLDVASWRRRIALVSQDVYVFNTTIRRNIAYGCPEASDGAIVDAATLANAHEFILQLPKGYETRVGDRGVRLSGGQKQRIALARAIVHNPDLLILDEATNALDSISENIIQEAVDQFGRDRTILIVAHRFTTIDRADHIVVLDQGTVAEQGTLPHLLNQEGLFSKLYANQQPKVTAAA